MTDRTTIKWSRANFERFFPDEAEDIIAGIGDVVESLTMFITTVEAVLDLVALIGLAAIDVLAAVLRVTIEAIDALIEALIGTSMRVSYSLPTSYKNGKNVSQNLGVLANSMLDKLDANRPYGESEDNYFGMLVVFGAVPSIDELLRVFAAFLKLFSLPDFGNRPKTAPSYYDGFYPPELGKSEGVAPNWRASNLADIGILGDFVILLRSLRSALTRPVAVTEHMRKMIEISLRRLKKITATAKKLLAILGDLSAFLVAGTGLYSFSIHGQGSVAQQAAAIRGAAQLPDCPFQPPRDKNLSGYVAFHTQAASGAGIAVFKTLFGLKDLKPEDVLPKQVEEDFDALRDNKPKHADKGVSEDFQKKWGS
jgi:hypothetical protein